jgi:hypothetical protein
MLEIIQQRCLDAANLTRMLIASFKRGDSSPEEVDQLLKEIQYLQQSQATLEPNDARIVGQDLAKLRLLLNELEQAGADWMNGISQSELDMLSRGQRMQRAYHSRNG